MSYDVPHSIRLLGANTVLYLAYLNAQPYDATHCVSLVNVYVELLRDHLPADTATQSLFKVLYDPLLTRVSDTDLARGAARRILQIIEEELETFTIQEILLCSAVREKRDAELEDEDDEFRLGKICIGYSGLQTITLNYYDLE